MVVTKSLVNGLTQQAAALALSSHISPADAIIQVIKSVPEIAGNVHTPVVQNLIRRVVTSTNKTVWLTLYAKLPDKTFSFPVADADVIINTLLKESGLSGQKVVTLKPDYAVDYTFDPDDMPALSAAENELIRNLPLHNDWDVEDDVASQLQQLETALLNSKTDEINSLLSADPQPQEVIPQDPLQHYPPILHNYLIVVDSKVKPNTKAIANLALDVKSNQDATVERDMQLTNLMHQIMQAIKSAILGGADPNQLANKVAMDTHVNISLDTLNQLIQEALSPLTESEKQAAQYTPDTQAVEKIASLIDTLYELTALQKNATDVQDLSLKRDILKSLSKEFPEVKDTIATYLPDLV